jgi:hypothetical protein
LNNPAGNKLNCSRPLFCALVAAIDRSACRYLQLGSVLAKMSALKRLSCYRIPDHRIARNLFAHGRAFPLPLKFALLAAALSLLMPAWSAIRSEGFRSASLNKAVFDPTDIFQWTSIPTDVAWAEVKKATPAGKPRAYWRFAIALIQNDMGQEAYGVLDLLSRAYPEAAANPNYAMARGQALVLMQRYPEALTVLDEPSLVHDSLSCLWRIRAVAYMSSAPDLSDQYACASTAFKGLSGQARIPFAVAMARHAYLKGHYPLGLAWVHQTPVKNHEVQLVKARLLIASGRMKEAQQALRDVQDLGNERTRAEVTLIKLQQAATDGTQPPDQILKALDDLRYAWRDHDVELRALMFGYQLARKHNYRNRALSMGATLLRNFPEVNGRTELLADYRKILVSVLEPTRQLSLSQSVGLYWEYRDLAPDGAEGDALAILIARRLEASRLYARAAQLLQYQLDNRAKDLAKGPLSVRAAILNIRAGQFNYALNLIRNTEGPRYPADIANSRKQVAAVALAMLGKVPEAIATLEGVPDSAILIAEILWHNQQWGELAKVQTNLLARGSGVTAGGRTLILRQAVALTIQGDVSSIKQLRERFQTLFAGTAEKQAFELLTTPVNEFNAEALRVAIENMPTSSPAGAFGDLLNLAEPRSSAAAIRK